MLATARSAPATHLMHIQLLNPQAPTWSGEIDRIGAYLRRPEDPALFPYHFLQVTLPRIGGAIALAMDGGRPNGVGFLFPRQRSGQGDRTYTMRYHPFPNSPTVDQTRLVELTSAALNGSQITFYDPAGRHEYAPSYELIGPVTIGRPDAAEANYVRILHQKIWGSPVEALYPSDIHSVGFSLGTSLVARVDAQQVGFLIGFYKFGGSELPAEWNERFDGDYRLESQIMGVLPTYRGLRIANLLKKLQAEQAWAEGIGVVNWTADPLQYPNAALNFGLLRAFALDFTPDLYPFRNELNRVHASRFSLTWLVGSQRVQEVQLMGSRATVVDLAHHRDVVRINDGWRNVTPDIDAPTVAFEIPTNWTELQHDDPAEAREWRTSSDEMFSRYVGKTAGKYAITGVGVDGERRYLIGEQISPFLLQRLAQ